MAIFNMIEESEATGKVKEIFEDIKQKRNIKSVNNFWKMLANEPETLERTWNSLQQVMKKGALDEMTKELIYIAVSITNSCEYCIKSHSSAAIKKGASKDMLAELNAVVGMANETNRLVESYQVKVDEIYE
ncbi:carboxymuconolactone decarboxylase family protein [Candidatus Pelagibacter sp.]|nr:carboxymuconolactone decarboxylase family protein [Candidatus Pelagibacter sp.]